MEIAKWDGKPIPTGFTGLLAMSEIQYHSDPCEKASLSSSIAKKIVTDSPFHGWLHHPKLGRLPTEATKEMVRGSILHALIAGQQPRVALIDAENFMTKTAKEARDSAKADGRYPCLLKDYREYEVIAEEVIESCKAEGIYLTGNSEVAAFWVEKVGNDEVQCRALVDHAIFDEAYVLDFKTCSSARPEFLSRAIVDHGYDIQWAAYDSGVGKIMDLEGRVDFAWVFIEELPDRSPRRTIVQVARPSGMMRELGRARWQMALAKWNEGIKSNKWVAYNDGPSLIDPPPWVLKDFLGRDS